jgi:NAD(P)-dependent dehydrogenase (short-subunit alcohol dehydrogenase family)
MAADLPKLQASNLFNVKGLNVVITGGGSGLGAMMARALAVNGAANVFILGRRLESLQKTAASVPTNNIRSIVCDVTSKESLHSSVEEVKSITPVLDVLICNHGVMAPSTPVVDEKGQYLPLEQFASNLWAPDFDAVNHTFAVNVTAVHFAIAAFLPLLHARNQIRPQPPTVDNFEPRPQIIATSSTGGLSRKFLFDMIYSPAKAGLIHMMKMLSTVLVEYDIRANTIVPGYYYTEMTHNLFTEEGRAAVHNVEGTWEKSRVPATRTGDEQDMAGAILWLCSRAGAYINGLSLVTDGGRLSVMPGTY